MSIGETLRMFLVLATRIVLYLPLLALRIVARLALVVATVAPIALPVVVVGLLYQYWPEELIAGILKQDYQVVRALTFLLAVGVVGALLRSIGKLSWAAFIPLAKAVEDIFRSGWSPSPEVLKSLAVTWRDNIAKIPGNLLLTLARAAYLTFLLAAFAILLAATLPLYDRSKVVDRHVVVVGAEDAEDEDTKETIKVHMRTDTVFSLTHLKNAQLKTGEGICLEKSQQAWLHSFRKAIAECGNSKQRGLPSEPIPRFVVTAFASVAPVRLNGVADHSPQLNCEIANRRADAVAAFLADESKSKEKWQCPAEGEDFAPSNNLCAGGEPVVYSGVHEGVKFEVQVNKWGDPAEMQRRKPAADGALPDDRRFGIEMLNRSVHITVPEDFCGTEERGESEPSTASPGRLEPAARDATLPSPPGSRRSEGTGPGSAPPQTPDASGGIE